MAHGESTVTLIDELSLLLADRNKKCKLLNLGGNSMLALVCDICSGKLIMGVGGTAVCGSCGMEYNKDRMQEKVQEVNRTVRVDNSHMIDNYHQIAQRAINSGNNVECEKYCNQVLELDPKNYTALVLKGRAAGWQSTVVRDRIMEAFNCFVSALEYAPEEEKRSIVTTTCEEIENLCLAIVSISCDHFVDYISADNAEMIISKTDDAITLANAYASVEITARLATEANIYSLKNIGGHLAEIISTALDNAWESVWSEYQGDEEHPSDWDFEQFLERADIIIDVLEKTIKMDADTSDKIQMCENLITINEAVRDSQSWQEDYREYGTYWVKSKSLTKEAKQMRQTIINGYHDEIRRLEAQLKKEVDEENLKKDQERREAIEKYWIEHAEEKRTLETEKQSLKEQINAANKEITAIHEREDVVKLKKHVESLTLEKKALGFLKLKEKKAIQVIIDSTSNELNSLFSLTMEPIKKRISSLESRLEEVTTELTKPR
jgi:uncharacterized Zn finger protein (UPF0148 family)